MSAYYVEITIRAVISKDEAALDRLHPGEPGCPLNILPALVERANAHGDETSTCPYCGGRAEVTLVRDVTPEDAKYEWPQIKGGRCDDEA